MKPVNDSIDEGDFVKAAEHAWNIANMIVYQKPHSGDPIWANGQESVLASLILYVSMEANSEEARHLGSVYKTLSELGQPQIISINGKIMEEIPLIELIKNLPVDHPAKSAFATAALAPDRTRGSFFSGMAADLRLFSDPSIVHLTSAQDHNLQDIGINRTAVFLVIPDSPKTRHFIASLYIDQAYQALVDLANENGNRIPNKVNVLLEEFGNMPKISDFDSKITVAAGRGIIFTLVLQNLNQLKTIYKDIDKTISGNCLVWIFLKTSEIETAKQISQMTGRYTVKTAGFSSTSRKNDYSASYSSNLTGRELLTPDEIGRWDNSYALVLRAGSNPAKLPMAGKSNKAIDDFERTKGGELSNERKRSFDIQYFIPGREVVDTNEDVKQEVDEENEDSLAMDNIW